MQKSLAQDILDILFCDPSTRRAHKDALSDWILDSQPHDSPLDGIAMIQFLAEHHPEILARLKINTHVKEEIARVLDAIGHK
ncbi:MAG: hypothetical protein C3F12_09630 [Candidatus Methylomirabilota bacterium]|nr:hypothetical protein [candidate division NC10 bacterium]PWB46292.1 MAG: hypothetical protein C3F12_09630 [candidate division NC10 bacterium]